MGSIDSIIIGKHTLESLTSGMYSNSYVVFREYLQNSVDSVDEAIKAGILTPGSEQIIVKLRPTENQIIITDNGFGIPNLEVEKTLISIGNSKKSSEKARGFRGIGRLSALSYCKRLTFSTSFKGETVATQIIIDASKLSELLADEKKSDVTVFDVLESIYTVLTTPEKKDSHYFSVQLDGVDVNSGLLSYENVKSYLEQNLPVPYNPEFEWGKEIIKRFQHEGITISSYNISLEYGGHLSSIYKPYKDQFLVDKTKNITDLIQDIQIIKIPNSHSGITAIGWLAKTNYKGSIYEKSVKGIRMRKGNILIGDYHTLDDIFRDSRFNGWSIGEIFAIDKLLIPNARRDNFEKNQTYFSFYEQLKPLATEITRNIRTVSIKRNVPLSNAIKQLNATSQQASSAISQGISGAQKGLISKKLKKVKLAVSNSRIDTDSEQYYQDIAFEELDMLIGKLKGTTKYKALNTISSLTNTEKKILERVIQIIESIEIDNADIVIDAILNKFAAHSK